MAGWGSVDIDATCDILDRLRKPITKKDRVAGPYPYYGATGVLDHVEGFLFDEPLVLLGEDGAKWESGENSAFPIAGKCWVNNHAHVLRPKRDMLVDSWLIYYLNYSDLTPFVTGLTVPKLNQGKLKQIRIPLPPLAEQERIVAILDEAFAAIATATANAKRNLANARELFENQLEATMWSRSATGAEVVLEDLTTHVTDGDHQPPPKSPDGIPFITISNINKDTREIDFSDTFAVPTDYYSHLKPNRKPIKGDILYTVTGSYGIPVLVKTDHQFCFQRHIGLIRPKPETASEWLYYVLLTQNLLAQAELKATGTAQKTVSLRALRSFRVPKLPSPTEQAGVVRDAIALDKATAHLRLRYQMRMTLLENLKQSLLHRAFTGELTADKPAADCMLSEASA